MRIAHLLMMPEPPRPELDAAVRDALLLTQRFGGELEFLYPAARHHRLLPRLLYGLPQLRRLSELDLRVDAHQVYSNGLYRYPALRALSKPILYTLTTPIQVGRLRPRHLARARMFVTPIQRDAERLRRQGAAEVRVVPPGIDLERFAIGPPPRDGTFVLMAGSAPWTGRQFRTKGILHLLEAAVLRPRLRLVLLWRGVLSERIRAEVARRRLEERVEVLDRTVPVEGVLSRAHAAVVLSESAKLVKAFPHSLLESLAAGRPVLVSRQIALAELVERTGAGEVVPELGLEELLQALDRLMEDYERRRRAAVAVDLSPFSRESFLASFGAIYDDLVAQPDEG